jgi:integrase
LSDGYSAKTVKNDMAVLEALFNLAADRAVISSVPRLPKVRPPKPRAEVLTAGEASHVIAATPAGWQRTWVLVLLRTGIRLGEGLALKWSAVDLNSGSLRIRATRWRGLEGTPKGGRERTVLAPPWRPTGICEGATSSATRTGAH